MARIDTDGPSTSKHAVESSIQPTNEEHSNNEASSSEVCDVESVNEVVSEVTNEVVSEVEIPVEKHTEDSNIATETHHQSANQIDNEEMEEGEINSTGSVASDADAHYLFHSIPISSPSTIGQNSPQPDESVNRILVEQPCIIDLTLDGEPEDERGRDEITTQHDITEEEERLLLGETAPSEQSVNDLPTQQTSIVSNLRHLEHNEEQTVVVKVDRLEKAAATFEATEPVQQTPVTPASNQGMFNFILMNRDELDNIESQPIDELEDDDIQPELNFTPTSSATPSPTKTPNTERKCADCQTPLEKKGKVCGKCYYKRRKDYEKDVEDAIVKDCISSATEKRHSAARECDSSDVRPDSRKRHHSRSSKKSVASRGSQERSCSVNEEEVIYLSDDEANVADRAGTSQQTANESTRQQIAKELPPTPPKVRHMAFKTIQPGSTKKKDHQRTSATSTTSNQSQPSTEFIPSSPPLPYILPAAISSNNNASSNSDNPSTSSNQQTEHQVPLSPSANLNTPNRIDSPEQNLENNAFYSTVDTAYRGPFRNITSRFGNVEDSSDYSAINPEPRNRPRNSGVLSRFDGSSSLFRNIGFQRRFGQQAENINNRNNPRLHSMFIRSNNDTGRPLNPNAPPLSTQDLIQMADDVLIEREAQEREERNAREQPITSNEEQQTSNSSGTVEVRVGQELDPSAWQHRQSNKSSSNQNPNTPPILSPIEPPAFTPPSSVGSNSLSRLNDFDDNMQTNASEESTKQFVRPRNPSGNQSSRFVENDLDSCAGQWEAPISDPYAFTSDSQTVDEQSAGSSSQQDNNANTDSTSRKSKSTNQRRRMPTTTNKRLYEKNRVKTFFQINKIRKRVGPNKKLNLVDKRSTSVLSSGKIVQEMMQSFGEIFDDVANEENSSSTNNEDGDDSPPRKCIECRQPNPIVFEGRCQKCKKNYQKRQEKLLKTGIEPRNTRCPSCNQIKPLMGRQSCCRSCYQKNQRQKQIKRAQIIARQEQLQKQHEQVVRCTKCQKEIKADEARRSSDNNNNCHIRNIKEEPKDYESCLGCNSYKPIYQNQRCYNCYERSQQSTSGQQDTPNNVGSVAENRPITPPVVDQVEQDPLVGFLNQFVNRNDDGSSNGSNASIITLSSAEAVTNTFEFRE
ncbi:hypothetical protein M3Y97_00689800 [Aphelenchoides bicaudatus]|nr:hypothetical protein M3Y97_00689800 [Aphelenchoides bicaudatus]